MKKLIYLFAVSLFTTGWASAQVLPSFQFGVKGGVNLSHFSTENTLSSESRAGYLLGFYARAGAAGFNFQPELYYTSKMVTIKSNTGDNKATFKSIDLPLLVGTRIGALGVGARFATGPLISFVTSTDQSFSAAAANAVNLNFKDQNYAWQFGVGLDVQKVSFDLRYELGLNKIQNQANTANTRINLFNLSVAYRLFSL